MRRLILLCCLLGVLLVDLGAQEIHWGPEISTKGKTIFNKTILLPSQDLLVVQLKKNNWKQRWDTELIKISSARLNVRRDVVIPMEYKKNNLDYKDIQIVNGKIFLFSSFYNRVKKKKYLYVNELSEKSFAIKPLMKLAEVESSPNQVSEFIIRFSPDSTKVGIVSLNRVQDGPPVLNLTLLDYNLSYLFNESIPLETTVDNFTISQIELNDNGEFFVLAKTPKARSKFDKSIVQAHSILHFNALGKLENSLFIDYSDKYISELKFELNNEHLLVGALFSELGSKSAKGVVYQKYIIDELKLEESNFEYFDYSTLSSQLSERGLKKAELAYDNLGVDGLPELNDIKIKKMIVRSDLGLVLLAEQTDDYIEYDNRTSAQYISPYFGYGYDPFYNSSNKTYHHHIYNDIFIININGKGQIDWVSRIPKLQHTINDRAYYSSFTEFTIKDQIGVIYNDHTNNTQESNKQFSYAGTNGLAVLSSVFLNGEQDREIISSSDGGIQVIPNASHQIDSDKLLLVGKGRSFLKIAILQL